MAVDEFEVGIPAVSRRKTDTLEETRCLMRSTGRKRWRGGAGAHAAETCVRLLKKYGDPATVDRGALAYGEAKAEYDGIIAGLTVALAQKAAPASLTDLEARLQRGFAKREAFCGSVQALVPSRTGEKGIIDEIVTGAVKGAVDPLIQAIQAIWMRHKDDSALTRKTIQTQLEAPPGPLSPRLRPPLSVPPTAANTGSAAPEPAAIPGLYDRPVLVIDRGCTPRRSDVRMSMLRGMGGDRLGRQDGAGLVVARTASCGAQSVCRPGREMSARRMP